jgi:uncharacterized damage-inducible protein DinB
MATPDLVHFRHLTAFHHWATGMAFDALSPASAEQLDRKWGGSFGTGRALLRHVVGAERLWVDRWNGKVATMPQFPATHDGREYASEWRRVAEDQQRFIGALTPARLTEDLTYVNMKGETKTYPLSHILIHCVNHGTYHRGQITHLLRDLELPAPGTDYLFFEPEPR